MTWGDACVFLMKHYSDAGFVNIGSGEETTIADLARLVAEVVGYQGRIIFGRGSSSSPWARRGPRELGARGGIGLEKAEQLG